MGCKCFPHLSGVLFWLITSNMMNLLFSSDVCLTIQDNYSSLFHKKTIFVYYPFFIDEENYRNGGLFKVTQYIHLKIMTDTHLWHWKLGVTNFPLPRGAGFKTIKLRGSGFTDSIYSCSNVRYSSDKITPCHLKTIFSLDDSSFSFISAENLMPYRDTNFTSLDLFIKKLVAHLRTGNFLHGNVCMKAALGDADQGLCKHLGRVLGISFNP